MRWNTPAQKEAYPAEEVVVETEEAEVVAVESDADFESTGEAATEGSDGWL